jgi:hypothetical protein
MPSRIGDHDEEPGDCDHDIFASRTRTEDEFRRAAPSPGTICLISSSDLTNINLAA